MPETDKLVADRDVSTPPMENQRLPFYAGLFPFYTLPLPSHNFSISTPIPLPSKLSLPKITTKVLNVESDSKLLSGFRQKFRIIFRIGGFSDFVHRPVF
jgi:hypothetical protein